PNFHFRQTGPCAGRVIQDDTKFPGFDRFELDCIRPMTGGMNGKAYLVEYPFPLLSRQIENAEFFRRYDIGRVVEKVELYGVKTTRDCQIDLDPIGIVR